MNESRKVINAIARIKANKQKIRHFDNLIHKDHVVIRANCVHSDIKDVTDYVSGGYLNKSQYIKYRKCTICGSESEKVITYGSFE